jgi:hypothetical protein
MVAGQFGRRCNIDHRSMPLCHYVPNCRMPANLKLIYVRVGHLALETVAIINEQHLGISLAISSSGCSHGKASDGKGTA